jgi:ABC-type nitrate/sulfonate/bicarbonate transport system substrate-binding protein
MKPGAIRALAAFATSLVLAACKAGPLASPTPTAPSTTATPAALSVSYSELTPINMALWIADDQGFFKNNGLQVDTRYLESSLGVSALLAGEEQFAAMGGSETLAAVLNGADLEALASFSPVYPYKLEVAASINSAADLKGKKLGVSRFGSSSDSATRAALRELGLNADTDVTLVQVGSLADRTAALLNGSLDGAVDGLPDTLILEAHGLHPLVDLAGEHLPAVNNLLITRKSWASTHKAVTQAYVDSIVQGIARAKSDKPLSLQLMQKYLQDRSGDATQMSAAYDYDIGEVMRIPPVVEPGQFRDAQTQLAATAPAASDFDVQSIIDNSYVNDAIARGLGNTATP